jgi:N-acetylglutamate synthase-like GNAT family acetyltransferase
MIDNLEISSDKSKLDLDLIINYLRESYWAKNISDSLVRLSIENSTCFGVYLAGQQIGFARLVTDCATFAYLCDVFVLSEYNGQGVAKQLLNTILEDSRFTGVRRLMLATRDAQSLYEKFGFELLSEADQQKIMQIRPITRYE